MKTIKGTFKSSEGKPVDDTAILYLTLSQNAKERRTSQKAERTIEIKLEGDGSIPPGTEILASDELSPSGTFYTAVVRDLFDIHYIGWLKIVGESPINLNDLTLEPVEPEPVEDEPEPPPPPPPFGVPRRIKAGGFFGGSVRPPTKDVTIFYGYSNDEQLGRTITPDCGSFEVMAFKLPSRTTINRVSIYIDTPAPVSVVVGLYDLRSRKKLCSVAIDASKPGPATGVFATPIPLSSGDYAYAWATSHPACNGLRVYGNSSDDSIVSRLMNLGDKERILTNGVVKGRVREVLPETLGLVEEAYGLPILAYFEP
jgi:hypothetical protein